MDRVREELTKIMDEPGRRESAKKVQDALDRTTTYIQERKMKKLWEILVPAKENKSPDIMRTLHEKWDEKVSEIAGGLTILKSTKGRWKHAGKVWKERMIQVRIAATKEEMEKIAKITSEHYNQRAVMYYLVSEEAVIKEY